MKLIRLSPTQFKSFKSFNLEANGKDLLIEGANGLGKTSLMDAYLWALTGKDSLGQASFEIKTLGKDGKVIQHGLDHSVEVAIAVGGTQVPDGERGTEDNPSTFTLRKTYKEQWTTRRGAADKEFTGHIVEHFIDGVPKSKGEFDAFVSSVCDPRRLLILSKPNAFNELPDDSKLGPGWVQRRRVLVDTFGDVSDADVMGSLKKFKPLAEALGGRSVDDHKKVLTASKKEVVDKRKGIPPRIDELTRQLDTDPSSDPLTPVVHSEAPQLADNLRARLKELNTRRAEIQSGGQASELTKRLRELEAEGQGIYNRVRQEAESASFDAQKILRQANFVLDGEKQKYETLLSQINICETELVGTENRLTELRAEFREVSAKVFTFEDTQTCPICKQCLPDDQVAAARVKGLEDFNQSKANILQMNRERGQEYAAKRKMLVDKIEGKTAELAKLVDSINHYTTLRNEAEDNEQCHPINDPAVWQPEPDDHPEYYQKLTEALNLQGLIATQSGSIDTTSIDDEIVECEQEIKAQDEAIARSKAQAEARSRIENLQAQEKTMGAEIEAIDKMLFLIEEFTKAKVSMLDDKINSKFSLVKWKLSEEQINGGTLEVCRCTVGGVPYDSLNHAMRIQAGLEIINVLSDAWGVTVPVWIDSAESINVLPETRGQQIALRVPDLKRRIEETEGAHAARVKRAQKLTVTER